MKSLATSSSMSSSRPPFSTSSKNWATLFLLSSLTLIGGGMLSVRRRPDKGGSPRVSPQVSSVRSQVYRRVVSSATGLGLLERERELAALRDGLDRASAGEGTLLLVAGPPGVGKTELLREARAAAARARVTALEAKASELERPFAFGVVRQLLEPVIGPSLGP